MRHLLTTIGLLLLAAAGLAGTDWPQWRGPGRDGGAVDSPRLLEAWPAGGPRRVWTSERVPLAGPYGWSSPVVAGGRVFITTTMNAGRELREVFYCLDSETGRTLWKRDYPSAANQRDWGASSTVCVAGDRLYCGGPAAALYCLSSADGGLIWQVDGSKWWPARPGAEPPPVHASFLVADGIAVIQGGDHDGPGAAKGAAVALDAATGAILWTAPKYGGEGSPVLWRNGEQAYVLMVARDGLTALELRTGKALWTAPPGGSSSTPLVVGDKAIILSDGYPKPGLICYRLSKEKAEQIWAVEWRYDAGSAPVVLDGHLYATSGNEGEHASGSRSTLLCVELATGTVRWQEKTPCGGYTNPLLADGKLIYTAQGQVVMVAADPARFRELGRMRADADTYASPTIADGRLFIRTGRVGPTSGGMGAVTCYDLRADGRP